MNLIIAISLAYTIPMPFFLGFFWALGDCKKEGREERTLLMTAFWPIAVGVVAGCALCAIDERWKNK